jgi:hypothetical protein
VEEYTFDGDESDQMEEKHLEAENDALRAEIAAESYNANNSTNSGFDVGSGRGRGEVASIGAASIDVPFAPGVAQRGTASGRASPSLSEAGGRPIPGLIVPVSGVRSGRSSPLSNAAWAPGVGPNADEFGALAGMLVGASANAGTAEPTDDEYGADADDDDGSPRASPVSTSTYAVEESMMSTATKSADQIAATESAAADEEAAYQAHLHAVAAADAAAASAAAVARDATVQCSLRLTCLF